MRFMKFFTIGALLTALCALQAAAAPKTGFAYRANERERLRQRQNAFMKIKRMVQISRSKPETVDELNKFAEGAIPKYRLNISLDDIRLHGTLLKIIHGDRQAVAEARADKFVICGVKYGKRCWNCRGNGKRCTYCRGTGKCPSCEGTGRMNYASKSDGCVQCDGSGLCSKCHGNPDSNPCNICGGAGVYCEIGQIKNRQRRLLGRIMEARITEAFNYDYLGTLYMNGSDGFPEDEERARLFFEMAVDNGFAAEVLARAKRAGSLPRAIAILREFAQKYPDPRKGGSEVRKLLTEYLHVFVAGEIGKAKRQKSLGNAVDILENLVKNYSDANNIAEAQTMLDGYRRKFIAAEIKRAERAKSYGDAVDILDKAVRRCPDAANIAEAQTMLDGYRRRYIAVAIKEAGRAEEPDEAAAILEKAIRLCPDAANIAEAQEKLQFYRQKYEDEQRMMDQTVRDFLIKFYNAFSDNATLYPDARGLALGMIRPYANRAARLHNRYHPETPEGKTKKAILVEIRRIYTILEIGADGRRRLRNVGAYDTDVHEFIKKNGESATQHLKDIRKLIRDLHDNNML